MAHKTLEDGRKVIDWETGDPEGDRKWMMKNYSEFIDKMHEAVFMGRINEAQELFSKWGVSTINQVDDFPRIWIKRPESNKP